MRVTVNPSAEPSGDFGYVAPGDYMLRVVKVELQRKSGGEHPYLKWTLELADPSIQCVNNEPGKAPKKPGQIFENTTLKPDAQFRLRDLSDALGLTWGDFDTDNVVGMTLKAKLTTDTYNDVISNKVAKFHSAK